MPTTIQTKECSISELNAPILAVLNDLIGEQQPLFCYEIHRKETGVLGYDTVDVVIVTQSDIFILMSSPEPHLSSMLFLHEITAITKGFYFNTTFPEIKIRVPEESLKVAFETKQTANKFIGKLRLVIQRAKSNTP